MNILKVLLATALALIVLGCAAPLPRADVTTFHQWSGEGKRTFELIRQTAQKDSLEHANYEPIVRAELVAAGFTETPGALFRISFEYSTAQGDSTLQRPGPVVGLGGIFGGGGVGVSIGVPIGGIGGSAVPEYARTVRLMIDDSRNASTTRVWESSAISTSSGATMIEVMPFLMQALLSDFPGTSGTTRTVQMSAAPAR